MGKTLKCNSVNQNNNIHSIKNLNLIPFYMQNTIFILLALNQC